MLDWNDGDGKDDQEVKPKRWRITEWHDHLGTDLKIRNPNIELPQKLFPKPVLVDNYTFIQPIDTHQLAAKASVCVTVLVVVATPMASRSSSISLCFA